MSLRVEVRDANRVRVAELDDYSALKVTLTSNTPGTWELSCPAASSAALALTFRGGLIVERDGLPFLSGPVTSLEVTGSRLDSGRVVETLTATGQDDLAVLYGRLALPSPMGPPYPDAYDTLTGPAETVLRHYVDVNVGPSASPARRRVLLEPDLGRGPVITGKPDRYDNLGEFLRETALGTGIGYRVEQVGTDLVCRFYEPTDRSRSVVFGLDRGNLLSYKYRTNRPKATYGYGGGTGELGERLIVERQDAAGVEAFDRLETFVDQSNVDDPELLAQRVDGQLVEQGVSSTLALEPIDGPDSTYGVDYQLDDLVTVRLAASDPRQAPTITDRVGQVSLAYSGGQETLTPVASSDGANLAGLNLVGNLRQLGRRLSRIEGR